MKTSLRSLLAPLLCLLLSLLTAWRAESFDAHPVSLAVSNFVVSGNSAIVPTPSTSLSTLMLSTSTNYLSMSFFARPTAQPTPEPVLISVSTLFSQELSAPATSTSASALHPISTRPMSSSMPSSRLSNDQSVVLKSISTSMTSMLSTKATSSSELSFQHSNEQSSVLKSTSSQVPTSLSTKAMSAVAMSSKLSAETSASRMFSLELSAIHLSMSTSVHSLQRSFQVSAGVQSLSSRSESVLFGFPTQQPTFTSVDLTSGLTQSSSQSFAGSGSQRRSVVLSLLSLTAASSSSLFSSHQAATRVPAAPPTIQPSAVGQTGQPTASPSRNLISTAMPSSIPTSEPRLPTLEPSQQPSGQPTAAPFTAVSFPFLPSPVPTSRPSVLEPTLQPTVAPSSHPTSRPSSHPSVVPVAPPSSQPSSRPSMRPSMSPTSQPTGSPTATPVRSNVIKTSRPTPSPTRKPTLCPSSLPTSRPSLTTETYLEDQLLDLIVNYTNADYSQVFYGEVGDRTSYTEGTCTSMVTSIGSASNLLQSSMYVASVALASSTYGSGIISNYNCSVKSTASTIVNSLISPTTSVVSTSCGGHTWKAKKCSTTSKLAFCVDCSDPCSTFCPSRNTFSVCSTPISCSGSSNEPFVQLLTVSLLPTVSPPTISSTSYTVTTSSISMSVSLSSGGTINVAIFSSGSSVRSVNDVLVQNIIYTVADSSSVAKIFFGSLSAAKSYDVYILTSSVTGAMMTTSQVTATKQTITTACCRPVAVGLSVVSLFQTRQGVNDVSVTAATRPDTNITVSLYLKHSESGNITHLLPSAVLFSANLKTALSQSLSISSLSTVSSGSLVLFANISGPDAAKYSVFYGTRTLKVIGLNEQPPTPVFSSAVFSNDGSKLLLGFNSATNKAGILSTAFTCSKLFSFTGVSAATCQWVSSSLVSAQLGPTATLVPGSSVSIASTASLTAACSTGDCSKWNKTAVTTLTISAPPLTLYPVVVVSAPSMVSTCAQLKLDWSASTGSAGRSWTANITAYGDVPASNLTTLNAYLQKIITSSGPLTIDRSYLSRGS
jgi:hypothetical protein